MMLSLGLGLSCKRPRTTSPSPATPDGPDHLRSLPVEMVEEILRRLPLDDAVRTSVLAKPWRYRWAECPGLELVAGDPPAAVDAVLNRYTCNISRAQLHVPEESYGKIDGWLSALATKGLRYLVLVFTPTLAPMLLLRLPILPSSLFSCRELISLLLKHCDILPLPPSFDSFPSLLALELNDVSFVENGERTFEALLAKCPSLRSLTILFPSIGSDYEYEGNYSEWTIRAPNLEFLVISAWQDYGWRIDDLPLIEEAHIHLDGPELPRILPGLTKVKNLSVEITDDTIVERLSYFLNLKDLSVHTILITKSSTVLSMFCILRNAPNLEDLRITSLHESEETDEVNMEELLSAQRTVGLFSRLKCFCLFESIGHPNEMQFIEFLMSKAAVLQEIEISVRDDGLKSPEVVFDELSQYKKASPQADVIVNRFTGYYSDDETDDE